MGLPKVNHKLQIVEYHQYLERPGLEYQHVFDLCAVEVHRRGGSAAVFTSNSFYARELLKRIEDCEVIFYPVDERIALEMNAQVASAGSNPTWKSSGRTEEVDTHGAIPTVVWAEPERESGEQILKYLQRILAPGGCLYMITSGWLARFLPEWQRTEIRPGKRPIGSWQIVKWLRQGGFAVKALYGFHGPVSILWGYASRLMERLGRSDLADRCLFQMRAEYVSNGQQALWAPVRVVVARKK